MPHNDIVTAVYIMCYCSFVFIFFSISMFVTSENCMQKLYVNTWRQYLVYCCTYQMFRGLCSCLSLGTWVNSAKTDETIEMFLVTDMDLLNRILNGVCTLALPGEYDWTIRARRWCGSMPNYFDHLLFTWLPLCIRWQWRNFDSYLCPLVFAAIMWVKLSEMFATVISLKYALLSS